MDDTELEREFLGRARSGFSPSHDDQERVRDAVARQIALSPLAPTESDSSEMFDGRFGDLADIAKPWLSRLAVAALVAAGSGTGYHFGHRAGVDEGRTHATRDSRERPELARPHSDERAVSEALAQDPAAATPEPTPPRTPAPQSSASVAGEKDARLDEEVRLLRRVERALRDHNPRYALALLADLERAVPSGQLAEERQAARVMARCQLEGGGEALARDFAEAHPGSAYLTRVVETCQRAPEQRIPAGAETHP